ncbi:hypothetical protein IU459_15980 [Nocardia amamiensis]|uniref:Uncharacterized protein n=1 Tax=Nocardia amamiensis TaxID=404578 RepID=A0ABS0CR23_9NOCA|nr:hypothetical protein [Nocardia amamiensis]MBF6299031.1 hypothetical protein [Nocardia amamiensis]
MDDAEREASEWRSGADPTKRAMAGDLERRLLRDGIERLADELATFTRSGEEMLALLRRTYPQMLWVRSTCGGDGFLGLVHPDTLALDAGQQCARRLGLPETEPARDGRRWEGRIEGWQIVVNEDAERSRRGWEDLDSEVVEFLLQTGAELPPVSWSNWRRGESWMINGWVVVSDLDDRHAIEAVFAGQWAAALGLAPDAVDRGDGSAEYTGQTAIGVVTIKWVADRERWNAAVAQARQELLGRGHREAP